MHTCSKAIESFAQLTGKFPLDRHKNIKKLLPLNGFSKFAQIFFDGFCHILIAFIYNLYMKMSEICTLWCGDFTPFLHFIFTPAEERVIQQGRYFGDRKTYEAGKKMKTASCDKFQTMYEKIAGGWWIG